MFVLYAIIASRIQYQACSIEYRASRIENHGAHGTIFTTVVSALQINLFMQNKANFRKSQMNVSPVISIDYEKMDTWSSGKTKPIQSQSKPIQSQLKPIKCQNKPKQTKTNPTCSELACPACPERSRRERSRRSRTYFKGKNSWFLWLLFG